MTPRGKAFAVLVGIATIIPAALALLAQAPAPSRPNQPSASVTSRENAYRANNIGVARLEQYDFPAATAAFRRALEIDPALTIARVNLGIALFYGGDQEGARKELESVRGAMSDRPQVEYVLGLIARSADRTDDAIEAFTRVRKLDPSDVGASINLGQLLVQTRRFDEAIKLLRPAVEAEPFNATAAYGLATALVRSGATDEGRVAMEAFQKLRESGYAVTFSQAYLEQGRYAEAIASTGAEPGLVSDAAPDVTFADGGVVSAQPGAGGPGGVSLADLDGDGDLDLIDAGANGLRLYRNDAGRFTPLPVDAAIAGAATGVVAGDADNDGDADLLVLRSSGISLLRQEPKQAFVDATAAAGLGGVPGGARTAAWLDADHDGDLDLLAGGPSSPTRLLRNNGKAVFEDVTATALPGVPEIAAVVPTDYDNRRDIDLLLLRPSSPPALYRNMRDGTFKEVAREVALGLDGSAPVAAAGDVNKDGFVDFFFGRVSTPGQFALSDGRGHYVVSAADPLTSPASAAQFMDYDNDGLLDLLVATQAGLRVFRNLGSRWMDVSAKAGELGNPPVAVLAIATGDVDGDGDTDALVRTQAGIRFLRNEGGTRNRSVRARLTARVSNRSAAGAKIEMRAGSLRQRLETYAATPAPAPADVSFGLGDRAGADVIRVLWPSGILQAEAASITAPATPSSAKATEGRPTSGEAAAGRPIAGTINVEELDRKPSSCPFLFTWTGERFEFLTDFLGGGEMGYWLAPGVHNTPDPDEYVRIPGSKLAPRDGRLDLRLTNELEEAVFLDRAELVSIVHPIGTEVYPNEGVKPSPEPLRLFVTRSEQPLVDARDEHGHDVRDRLAHMDRRYPDDFALEPLRGYAAEHTLTLRLPAAPSSGRRVLLMTGWTDYAFSGDNVAAHQRDLRMVPPMLQVPDGPGRWRTVIEDIGFPAGRPQTVPVDLTSILPRDATMVRIVTTMRVYWDRIAVGVTDETVTPTLTRLEAGTASLRWRGFSAERTPDGREPFGYDYDQVSAHSPWKVLPGRYTRFGDVRELLRRTDDFFVVSRPGDEIALTFDAAALPPLPEGSTRTFLLYASGYSKEMDLNSSSPDELAPLPFAAMTSYPYAAGAGPRLTPARQRYLDDFQTRIVPRTLPPIELIGR
jgi:Flp pilus assembly protein TadD